MLLLRRHVSSNNCRHPQGDCRHKNVFLCSNMSRSVVFGKMEHYKIKWLRYQYLILNNY
jgi:hypothetical protein